MGQLSGRVDRLGPDLRGRLGRPTRRWLADVGNYLRAAAVLHRRTRVAGKSAPPAVSASAVVAATTGPSTGSEVGDAYDTNPKDGVIEGLEVIEAVRDYFANDITGSQVIEVVRLYFASR